MTTRYIFRRPNPAMKRLAQFIALPENALRELGDPNDDSLDVHLGQLALALRAHSPALVCSALEDFYAHHYSSDVFLECASAALATLKQQWVLFFPDAPETEIGLLLRTGNSCFLLATKGFDKKTEFEIFHGIRHMAEMKLCLARNHFGDVPDCSVEIYAATALPLADNPNLPLAVEYGDAQLKILNNYTTLAFRSSPKRPPVKELFAAPSLSKADTTAYPKVDLLIPVYNNPDLLPPLFATLAQDPDLVDRVIVGDDCSTPETAKTIEKLAEQYKSHLRINVIRQPENVGFVRNVNAIYREAHAPIAILLNTDILLPHGWVERMVRPFVQRSDVGLATALATNGANLTVLLPGGTNWRGVDKLLQRHAASYERACTAIGYCMAIATKHFPPQDNLFCEEYIKGYGEDSDLHFRCLERGADSVVVDNLLIHHYGGKTFDLLTADSDFHLENRRQFFKKWKRTYQREMDRFGAIAPLSGIVNREGLFAGELRKQNLDVLFVLPAADTRYGGVNSVFKLATHLVTLGFNANIVTIAAKTDSGAYAAGPLNPFASLEQVGHQVQSVSLVVATSLDTVPSALAISGHYGAISAYFIQGPEIAFSCGIHAEQVVRSYNRFDILFCVSKFLCKFISDFTDTEPVCLHLGPSTYTFYDHNLDREPRSVAISLNTTPEKGAGIAVSAAYKLKERGFKVIPFGRDCKVYSLSKDFDCQGWLDDKELAKLFSKVSYYFDSSVYEGLGLLPIESALCGAIPIMSHNGGCDQILIDGQDCCKFAGIGDMERVIGLVDTMQAQEEERLRTNGRALFSKVSQEKAFDIFANRISEIL